MRTFDAVIGGETIALAVTFGASLKVADAVGDPLMISREAAKEAMFSQRGIEYEPKWSFSLSNVTQILWIGATAAGSKITFDEMGEKVLAGGLFEAKNEAGRYLGAIVSPGSEEVKPEKSDAEKS